MADVPRVGHGLVVMRVDEVRVVGQPTHREDHHDHDEHADNLNVKQVKC